MLHAAGILYMIIFAPADAFILQWHYHYQHNCIFKPPRDASLLQNPLAHHNTLPLGRGPGFPARLDITLREWIKHGHFPPRSLLFCLDCLAETKKRMEKLNEKYPHLVCFFQCRNFSKHIRRLNRCKVFDTSLPQKLLEGVLYKSDTPEMLLFIHKYYSHSLLYIFFFHLCENQTLDFNATWRAFLYFLM